MSTISSVASAGSTWSDLGSTRASARKDRMFAKADANGDGTVDKTELQTVLDNVSSKTGQAPGSADDLMSQMDADGSGSLSQDELADGMRSLMQPPASTMDFAQQRVGGPPPTGSSDDASAAGTTSTSTDPLDTNGDSTVSAQERAVGELKDMLAALGSAMDTDSDKTISQSEADSFKSQISALVEQAMKEYGAVSSSQADALSTWSPSSSTSAISVAA